MLICDDGVVREMAPDEEWLAEHLPDPTNQTSDADKAEAFDILLGGAS